MNSTEEEIEHLDLSRETQLSQSEMHAEVADAEPTTGMPDNQREAQFQDSAQETPLYKSIYRFLIDHCQLSVTDAAVLMQNFCRDPIWAVITALGMDVAFEQTDNFWENTAAEVLLCSIVVLSLIPLNALLLKKIYKVPYREVLIDVIIASVACLLAIVPWNVFQNFGKELFLKQGFDEQQAAFLSALFPGLIEPYVQALVNNVGSFFFNASYRGTVGGFIAALLPYQWLPGDIWQLAYASTLGIKNVALRTLAAGFAVGSVMPVANFAAIKATAVISKAINNCLPTHISTSVNNYRNNWNVFFSPQIDGQNTTPAIRPALQP